MTVITKGQLAIPQDIRLKLGLLPGTRVVLDIVTADDEWMDWSAAALPPDFYIGAHALLGGMTLLTRDPARYRTCFPRLRLVAP